MTNGIVKVLLVEDDEDGFAVTRQMLRDIGGTHLELEWVTDYQEALRRACSNGYDVGLVDYRLAEHDGVTLLRDARHYGCKTPMILLTGQGDHAVDVAAMNAGAVDFLNKTELTPALLERAIRYAIEHHRAEEQRYRSISELIPFGIWTAACDGGMVYLSESFLDLLGMSMDEARGFGWADRLPPEDCERTLADWKACVEHCAMWDYEYRIRGRDAQYRHVLSRGVPLRDGQGHLTAWVGIHLDITDRKRAEEQLARKTEELARSNAELEEFASVVSHDLRSPLLSMTGCMELLVEQFADRNNPEVVELVTLIRGSVNHMGQLIKSLLDYSRAGSRGLNIEPCEAEAVFRDALSNIGALIDETSAEVSHDPLPTVMADAKQLIQLLQNLIENGIKYHGQEPPRVQVSARPQPGRQEWLFAVKDNGIGIDPQFHQRVFQIFQRLHGNDSGYNGTGIGLAICKKIVTRHGGRIWVESTPGQGATFFFTLPMAAKA